MPRRVTSRDRILEGSAALARERGLASLSIRGVAGACGISTGTIYAYFPSRDELVAATAERLFEGAFRESFCHPSPSEGYLAYCERLYRSLDERLSQGGSDWLGQLHSLDQGAREAGRRRMERLLAHMLAGLEDVLENDPDVRRERLVGALRPDELCRLTLDGMFDAVRRGDPDCDTLFALLAHLIYDRKDTP